VTVEPVLLRAVAGELLARVSGVGGAVRQHNPLDVGQDL